MKKIITIVLFLIFIGLFVSCYQEKSPVDITEITSTTTQVKRSETTTKITTTTTPTTIIYTLPSTIKILPDDDDFFVYHYFIPKYRNCYYEIRDFFMDLVTPEELTEFVKSYEKQFPLTEEKSVMYYKAYVEYFNIPKEVFEEAVQKSIIHYHIKGGEDISLEQWEIPNPDIIYTFDDEIINEYYRRK